MASKQEYEGVAFSAGLTPDGWQVSVTERAESSVTAYANLIATMTVMKEDGLMPFVSSYNKAQENIASAPSVVDVPNQPDPIIPAQPDPFPEPASVVAQAQDLGGVEDPFANAPQAAELVDYLKKAGEWKTGDVQECAVDQYTLFDGAITFYQSNNQYPEVHKHYLSEVGVKVMQSFGDNWDKAFATTEVPTVIPGGDFIIGVKGGKMRTEGMGKGNVWRNLVSARRP